MFFKIHVESSVLYKLACYNLRYAVASSSPSDYLPAHLHKLPLEKNRMASVPHNLYGTGHVCLVNKTQGVFFCLNPKRTAVSAYGLALQ
jgi:hypothetical protein